MRQLIPTPYTVVHISRQLDKTQKDRHGNYVMAESTPVVRKVQSITVRNSREVFTSEVANREEALIDMAVPNPDVYKSGDQVLIDAQLSAAGQYVPGSGTAYFVDGEPTDDRKGPWKRYLQQFGGIVKLRRVT